MKISIIYACESFLKVLKVENLSEATRAVKN